MTSSQRPDGTWRKPVRVKPGYVAPELVPKYKAPHIVSSSPKKHKKILDSSPFLLLREEERRRRERLPWTGRGPLPPMKRQKQSRYLRGSHLQPSRCGSHTRREGKGAGHVLIARKIEGLPSNQRQLITARKQTSRTKQTSKHCSNHRPLRARKLPTSSHQRSTSHPLSPSSARNRCTVTAWCNSSSNSSLWTTDRL